MHDRIYYCVTQAAIALVMPSATETLIKEYLLQPKRRLEMAAQRGMPLRMVRGIAELKPLLSDRTFLCLHYRLSDTCQLTPCTVALHAAVPQTAPMPPQQQSAALAEQLAAQRTSGPVPPEAAISNTAGK